MKKIIFSCLVWTFALTTFALDWPVGGGELRASFGQNIQGTASAGVRFASKDAVRAADAGEVFFSAGSETSVIKPGSMPHPLGDWTAIDNGNGLMTVYGHLQNRDPDDAPKSVLEKGAVIGRCGTSGCAEYDGLFFAVFDRQEKRWVNPAMLAQPRPDNRAPVIKQVTLVSRDGQSLPLPAGRPIKQGNYRVQVEAYDAETNPLQTILTPFRLLCLVNGSKQGALHLETIKVVNGEQIIARMTATAAGQVYLPNQSFDLGEIRLARGRSSLEIIARDITGNERILSLAVIAE